MGAEDWPQTPSVEQAEDSQKSLDKKPEIDTADTKEKIFQYTTAKQMYAYERRMDKVNLMDEKTKELVTKLYQAETGSDQIPDDNLIEEYKQNINNEKIIAGSNSFRELYKNLDQYQIQIKGSDGYIYDTSTIIKLIVDITDGKKSLNYLTRSLGLRDKVQELLDIETIKNKK